MNQPAIEAIPAVEPEATPLANLAVESGRAAGLTAYLGVLTPEQLDAPEAETGALLQGAGLHDLGWLRRIAVRGEDRERWLSGMVTNTVEGIENDRGTYNLVLNAQGRIQGDAWVWREDGRLELELTAAQVEPLLTHLDRFIIMDDVELVPEIGLSALGITGPLAGKVLQTLGLASLPDEMASVTGEVLSIPVRVRRGFGTVVPHYAVWVESSRIADLWRALETAETRPVGATALETLRVVEGIPAYGIDIESRDLPQETSQMRALNFTKGCYLGQEIVERIRSRGQVHRHLRHMEIFPAGDSAPESGTELRIAGSAPDAKPAGRLTSVTTLHLEGARRTFALGLVRAEAELPNRELVYEGGSAVLLHAPPEFNSSHASS